MRLLEGDSVKLVVDKRCKVVEKSDDEFSFVIVSVAELRLWLEAFFCRDKCDWGETAEKSLSLLLPNAILQVIFVEKIVGNLSDVRVASVLSS